MADNPGIKIEFFGDRELEDSTFTRPGTVIPEFVPPIIGFHTEESFDDSGNDGHIRGPQKSIKTLGRSIPGNPGILYEGFYHAFWRNRVHIIPAGYELGNVLSPQQRPLEIYNSGETIDDARVVEAIVVNNGDGFSFISGNVSTPFSLGARQSEEYVWEVSQNGPPVIDITLDYQFSGDNGSTVTLVHSITGSRLVLFGFEPQASKEEVLEWATSIIEGFSGREQRVSTRHVKTRAITHTFHLDDLDGVRLEALIAGWLQYQVGLPIWDDTSTLSTATVAGVTTTLALNDSTTNTEFAAGELVAILTDPATFEVGTIQTVNASSIDLVEPVVNSWAVGALVLPLKTASLRDGINNDLWVADGLRKYTMTFDVVDPLSDPDESAFTAYRSAPVWEDGLTLKSHQYQRVISKKLIRAGGSKSNPNFAQSTKREQQTSLINGFTVYAEDRAAVIQLKQWFDARRGRQKSFWLPTSKRDFEVDIDQLSLTNEIEVLEAGWDKFISATPGGRRDIRILYADGSIEYRRINSAETTATGERLFLDSATSQLVTAANVQLISYLQLVRQNIDKLKLQFDRLDELVVGIPLIEVTEE